jgi:signal transduction histidine kinase
MSAIQNTVYALKDMTTVGDPRFERPLARIERSIDRCNKIIEELLDFTQMRELQLEPHPFDAWLGEVIATLATLPGITIAQEFGAAETLAKLDSDRMRRVVIHLIDNASHALLERPNRGAVARIVTRTRADDDSVTLEVEDNGHGIAPEILDKVFEPLFSTKNFGTGLGLPTVKQIVLQHGGDIELTSVVGEGTRARIRLPRTR